MYSAADRAVRDVFVDGRQVVKAGTVLTVDRDAAGADMEVLQREMVASAASRDRLGRDAEVLAPLALPLHRQRSLRNG